MTIKKSNFVFILGISFIILVTMISVVTEAGNFVSDSYGGKTYKLFIPSGYQTNSQIPLVVMLHGCTQDPDNFATGTRMNELAEEECFFVLYPDQPSSANQDKCWNWFDPTHQSRGQGEPAVIVGMVNEVKSSYSVDENRIYIAGISAGAAMTVIMGVTYPDVFAAICVNAGLEYKAATSMTEGFTAMSNGGPDPVTQGNTAYNVMGSRARVVPTIVFHGTSDYTVYPVNAHQVITQMAQTADLASDGSDNDNIDDVADETIQGQVPNGRSYTKYIYKDTTGKIVLEKYMINGMGHAWPGGSTSGTYTDPNGPDATRISWNFFKDHPMDGSDTTPPVTTADPPGGEYTESITVELNVNEPAETYYTLDGSTPTINSNKYSSPITVSGTTTLKFFSVDSSGNEEQVKIETYTITDDTTPPITAADPASGTYSNSVMVKLIANEPGTTYYTCDDSTPTTESTQYDQPITITSNTTLKFFSVDIKGNTESVKSESYNITQSSNLALSSIGSEDGFVGMFSIDGVGDSVHKIGDKGFYNSDTFRVILSFDTSQLPDNAVIESAKLRLYRKSLSGTVKNINVDIIDGYFGSSRQIEQEDYNDSATSTDIVSLEVPAFNNNYSEVELPIGSFEHINKNGRTQFRLKASTNVDYTSDIFELYGGENSSYAPQLIIEYGESDDLTPPQTYANPTGGEYTDSVSVTLSVSESATTYYTLDGSTPTEGSYQYVEPLIFTENTTLKFLSIDLAGNKETVKTEFYIINKSADTTPPVSTANPEGGTYTEPMLVELMVNEPAIIYYTLDGSTPTTSSNQYNTPLNISESTILKFFAVDSVGNIESVNTQIYNIVSSTEVSFTSIGSEDGYVGQYLADGMGTSYHIVGDKGMYSQDTYRVILSFDTSSLPDNVQITGAKLRIYRKSLTGTVNSLSIDIVMDHFGAENSLEYADYDANVSASLAKGAESVAIISVPSENNQYSEVSFPVSALQFINKTDRTQLRLHASTAYDFTIDQLDIYGGESSNYSPVLIVTY